MSLAQLWPPDVGNYIVLFSPEASKSEKITAVLDAGGEIIDQLGDGAVLVVATADPAFKREVRDRGAWLLFDAAAGFGCTTVKDVHAFNKSQL